MCHKKNRSCIDFFFVTENCCTNITDCAIAEGLQSSIFDHKAISLSTIKNSKQSSRPCIANFIMKDPLISDIVRVSLFECFVHHAIN